jgi:hypothetical protein
MTMNQQYKGLVKEFIKLFPKCSLFHVSLKGITPQKSFSSTFQGLLNLYIRLLMFVSKSYLTLQGKVAQSCWLFYAHVLPVHHVIYSSTRGPPWPWFLPFSWLTGLHTLCPYFSLSHVPMCTCAYSLSGMWVLFAGYLISQLFHHPQAFTQMSLTLSFIISTCNFKATCTPPDSMILPN